MKENKNLNILKILIKHKSKIPKQAWLKINKNQTQELTQNGTQKPYKLIENKYLGSKSIPNSIRGPIEAPWKSAAAISNETLFFCSLSRYMIN